MPIHKQVQEMSNCDVGGITDNSCPGRSGEEIIVYHALLGGCDCGRNYEVAWAQLENRSKGH